MKAQKKSMCHFCSPSVIHCHGDHLVVIHSSSHTIAYSFIHYSFIQLTRYSFIYFIRSFTHSKTKFVHAFVLGKTEPIFASCKSETKRCYASNTHPRSPTIPQVVTGSFQLDHDEFRFLCRELTLVHSTNQSPALPADDCQVRWQNWLLHAGPVARDG